MTAPSPAAPPAGSQQVVIEAALVLLERMGLSPADLTALPPARPVVPTFADYVPVVSAAVSAGTRRAYGSYWNRVVAHWGSRRLDEPTPSDIRQLMAHVKAHVVARRNARGGRSAAEHLVAALRCLYRHAEDDGLIAAADNPARKVAKPRRLPSTRRAVPEARLAEINQVAAATGNDPELDTLLLRLHTETVHRLMAALAPGSCLALSHLIAGHLSPRAAAACVAACQDAPDQLHLRTRAEVATYLNGLDLIAPVEGAEPQVARASLWDADTTGETAAHSSRLWWAGVGRKA